jgi:IS5 family transposase
MVELRDILELDQDDLPDYTTIYKSFDRLKMWVWRALLRVLFSRILMESRSLSDSEAEYAVKRLLYQGYLYEVDRQAFFTEREDDSPESG